MRDQGESGRRRVELDSEAGGFQKPLSKAYGSAADALSARVSRSELLLGACRRITSYNWAGRGGFLTAAL